MTFLPHPGVQRVKGSICVERGVYLNSLPYSKPGRQRSCHILKLGMALPCVVNPAAPTCPTASDLRPRLQQGESSMGARPEEEKRRGRGGKSAGLFTTSALYKPTTKESHDEEWPRDSHHLWIGATEHHLWLSAAGRGSLPELPSCLHS